MMSGLWDILSRRGTSNTSPQYIIIPAGEPVAGHARHYADGHLTDSTVATIMRGVAGSTARVFLNHTRADGGVIWYSARPAPCNVVATAYAGIPICGGALLCGAADVTTNTYRGTNDKTLAEVSAINRDTATPTEGLESEPVPVPVPITQTPTRIPQSAPAPALVFVPRRSVRLRTKATH